ncbi:MMPL/RND family transporter [Mycolicibacter icosiumassiliensis]|uniref:MMPL/RND family transporter n=1 Tax=Mycolicibacter icosiumassiliensis TaxID=1792835 RepID=UPI000832DB54|nr:RND family transporter [Mycolicibacter icosiumassiliensis]
MSARRPGRPAFAAVVHKFAIPVILAWLGISLLVSLGVPPLEQVAKDRAVSLSAQDAPSLKAMARIGELFQESDTDSITMIVLESEQPLGEAAHRYYDELIGQLNADSAHVQHVQDFWGDPLTAPGVQSADGKAVYVQLNLVGNMGEAKANESVDAVREIVNRIPAPPGVSVYVTGPTPLSADMMQVGDRAIMKITLATVVVIAIMLLLVYRSIATVALVLVMIGVELTAVRGIVAFLSDTGVIRISTFAISILVCLAIAAGTDYVIFFIGRYHEARHAGEDRTSAYYTAYRGVAHVILASGLTVAGATYCLSFTRLPIFQTMGAPCAVGMLVAVAVALTLVPAVLAVAGRFGLLEPKRTMSTRGWRRVGTAVVRWPAPIFLASCAVALVGLLALTGFQVNYDDRPYMPRDTPANVGWAAAERHFSEARLRPDVLVIESDHDLRNSADFLVLNRLAKAIFRVEGVALVQGVTRPEGAPLEHTSVPFLLSLQSAGQLQNIKFVKDRIADMHAQADDLSGTIASLERAYALMQEFRDTTHHIVGVSKETIEITREIRDDIANFDDFFRTFRNYFYWEPHCANIPVCAAMRSAYDASDGIDRVSEKLDELTPDLDNFDTVMPQVLALVPPQIATIKSVQNMLLTANSTMTGIIEQMEQLGTDASAMGQDFDAAQNDDSFYLPRSVFGNPDFQRVMKLFLSPDGKAARFIITHRGNPSTEAGIARIDPIKTAAEEALKGTPLATAKIYVAGNAAVLKDLKEGSAYDLLIAGTASLCIIFIIMLILTRSLIAALVIVGTVVGSLGASFGLSVLVWQYLLGLNLHWMVPLMAIIILLAVGADYNLLLVARFKEEIAGGLKTGIIRGMGGTGKIVSTAGLVFAFTMAAMIVSDLRVVGQVGTTIGLGLLFDTLVVRSFMTPSAAALLGRWFWWPQQVPNRSRASQGHRSLPSVSRSADEHMSLS